MELEQIKKIIIDQRTQYESVLKTERIVPRERVKCHPRKNLATIISGPRRSGKSTFALQSAIGQPHAYVNFDDERLSAKTEELNQIVETFHSLHPKADLWIFDEIHIVPGWEKFIARIIPTKKVVITGSNSKLLSGELATHLTGRHQDVRIFPFSFREYLTYQAYTPEPLSTTTITELKDHLHYYIEHGGYPLAYQGDSGFYPTLYSDILHKDITARHRIQRHQELKDLAKLILVNTGSEISFNKLKNILKIASVNTVSKYVSFLEAAFLIFPLRRFSFKIKEQVLAPKKIYAMDTGFVSSIVPSASIGKGRLMENAVAVELMRQTSWQKNQDIGYWKDHAGHEVDFIVLDGGNPRQLIQSCYDASNPLTLDREIKSLRLAMSDFKLKTSMILTWDEEKTIEDSAKQIRLVPLWKWLLEIGTFSSAQPLP